jgi:SAM-dependent methyltransferase
MEESQFPYEDNTFDVVLYCEIIEHLLMNPVNTQREINRVLKPNGTLVVITPNVAGLGNVFAMVDGRSLYDPYSGYGVYGPHNRDYASETYLGPELPKDTRCIIGHIKDAALVEVAKGLYVGPIEACD